METVHSQDAPDAIGPYSQAKVSGPFMFCSGQVPLNPKTMQVEAQTIEEQTEQVFDNMTAVLKAGGVGLSDVIKTTVFMRDLGEFSAMNSVYEKRFGGHKPARSTVQVAKLPLDVKVEIECVVVNP